ncbi:hypothetical protein D9756_005912 [Leucocoprinus leucothites]|uniref:Uncharacterized protein n=1 Tax=Leucocoprinus leucothites TaxID=201217 RepID=A0A8H5FXU5_9AGAR|nr:hypothetical protein D9756_005912 [Leucoagaricus leucothites]
MSSLFPLRNIARPFIASSLPSPSQLRIMSTNAVGLKPEESKALKERPIQGHEQPIITAIKEMYTCSPKDNTFDIYTGDAVFHDPVGIAKGPNAIKAQFVGLAKIFPRAEIPSFRILENPPSVAPRTILIDQDVSYYRNPKSSPTKTLNSLLTITLDDSNKIRTHTEEWNHRKNTSKDDGFLGMLNEERKKMTANLTEIFVGKN